MSTYTPQSDSDPDEIAQKIAGAIIPLIADYLDGREPPEGGGGDGLTEGRVIELIREHGGSGEGLTAADVTRLIDERLDELGIGEIDETRKQVDTALRRVHSALDELETSLARVVGPSADAFKTLPADHDTPGWGIQFSVHEPIRLGKTTYKANRAGELNIELYEYRNGSNGALIGTKHVDVPREGIYTVDLGMHVPEGQYLLTRDYTNQPGPDKNVDLARDGYTGWAADSGDDVTFHGGAHDQHGDNKLWYYFHDLHIRPAASADVNADSER